MKEYSDCARKILNKLGCGYLFLFILIFGSTISIWPQRFYPSLTIRELMGTAEFWIIAILATAFLNWWVIRREPIIKENGKDLMRKRWIDIYCSGSLEVGIKTRENWLNKKLSFVSFASDEKKEKIAENKFWSEFRLRHTNYNNNIYEKTGINIFFDFSSGKLLKIKNMDCFALLPRAGEIELFLARVFDFIQSKYRKKKGLDLLGIDDEDYTLKAIRDFRGKIIKHVYDTAEENYKEALEIFLSGEEFEVAGVEIEGRENQKLFLITALKTDNKKFLVFFPTETAAEIFQELSKVLKD